MVSSTSPVNVKDDDVNATIKPYSGTMSVTTPDGRITLMYDVTIDAATEWLAGQAPGEIVAAHYLPAQQTTWQPLTCPEHV